MGVARGLCFELSATVFADSDTSLTVTTQCLESVLLRGDTILHQNARFVVTTQRLADILLHRDNLPCLHFPFTVTNLGETTEIHQQEISFDPLLLDFNHQRNEVVGVGVVPEISDGCSTFVLAGECAAVDFSLRCVFIVVAHVV